MTFDSKVKCLKCVNINCNANTFRHKWLIIGTLIVCLWIVDCNKDLGDKGQGKQKCHTM